MRSAGTAARPAGSTLHGSMSRSAVETTAGRSTRTCAQPSSCSARMSSVRSREREVAGAGDEGEPEQLGELGADLAGVGVDRVAAGEHEVEAAEVVDGGGERTRGGEGVGAGERRVGDEDAVGMSTSRSGPHAIASRSTSSAAGGPSVMTVTVPPCSAARATAWATARRQ